MKAALIGVALLAAACASTGEIHGYKVRGTAPELTPVEEAAREFWDQVGETVAEAYGTSPEAMRRGHYSDDPGIQAAVDKALAERTTPSNDLHRNAPQWFRDGWRSYLDRADSRYSVLAVDKNNRGWGAVFCSAVGDCSSSRSFRLLNEQRALKNCRQNVRENHPAMKPDCAIYAIKDRIVWTGPMPWE